MPPSDGDQRSSNLLFSPLFAPCLAEHPDSECDKSVGPRPNLPMRSAADVPNFEDRSRPVVGLDGLTRSRLAGKATVVPARIAHYPEARLYRKGAGKEATLCFIGHALMENRNALFVDACLTPADGHAERIAALHMIEPRADRARRITPAADKGDDAEDFVNELRSMRVTPHVAQNVNGRSSAADWRTTRREGYGLSLRIRKRIEEGFGRIKTVAGQEKTKFRGRERVGFAFTFAAAGL